MDKYLEIGQIVNTFGIKGMVKVKPFSDDIRRFDKLKNVYIKKNSIEEKYKKQSIERFEFISEENLNKLRKQPPYLRK